MRRGGEPTGANPQTHEHGREQIREHGSEPASEHARERGRERAGAQGSDRRTASAGVASAAGLALLGGACCALPAALVVLGAGGAVASLMSAAPWLVTLSRYKALTFVVTALALAYSWARVRRAAQCEVAGARRLRWQRRVLWCATLLFAFSVCVAYVLPALLRAAE